MKFRLLSGVCAALTLLSLFVLAVLTMMSVEVGWYLSVPLVFWGPAVILGMLARPGFVPHRGCMGDEEEL